MFTKEDLNTKSSKRTLKIISYCFCVFFIVYVFVFFTSTAKSDNTPQPKSMNINISIDRSYMLDCGWRDRQPIYICLKDKNGIYVPITDVPEVDRNE
jgi:hypothetical protein